MPIFLLLFVGIPVFELYLMIQVGSEIGALSTIALTILTAAIGGALVRYQGLATLMRAQAAMHRGEVPALPMLEGAVLVVAGLILLLPGFVTDAVGFALLVPPLRHWLVRRFVRVVPLDPGQPAGRQGPDRVLEVDYRRDDD